MEAFEDSLRELRWEFLRGCKERLARMTRYLERLREDGSDAGALGDLRREFHGFSGLGTTYGFPDATALGLEGEAACDGRLSHGGPPAPEELSRWRSLVEGLEKILRLPAGGEPAKVAPASSARPFDVLLVDPDKGLRDRIVRLGAREGFQMRTASTKAEALEEISRLLPDGVLVEVGLPDGSGYEVVERVRSLPAGQGVTVLILGGSSDFLDRVEAIHCGADGFFEKPLQWEDLARRLQRLLERTRSEVPRILSVEDDPDQAAFIRRVLESAGYEVRGVSDPKEFESALISFRPDLVLMDILLPGVSGYDLARYLRQDERYAALPVLFLTSERQMQVRIEAVKAGGDDHLLKPVPPALLLSTVAARVERARTMRDLLEKDGLTRLLTHTAFLERARIALSSAGRKQLRCALVMLDLDHFKRVNDRYGHPVGDRVLVALASALRQRLRPSDTLGRLGGEEFAILLEDLDPADVVRLTERLRKDFSEIDHRAPDGSTFRVTFSAGAAVPEPDMDLNRWVAAADAALYRAKAEGRNRVVSA